VVCLSTILCGTGSDDVGLSRSRHWRGRGATFPKPKVAVANRLELHSGLSEG